MKKNFEKFISLALILIVTIHIFPTHPVTSQTTTEALLLDDITIEGTQENTLFKSGKYATHYFYNLNDNLGYNSRGSCSYIAIGMLLSYYDTYWSDSFIHEDLEQRTLVATYPTHSFEAPGIVSDYEIIEQINSMTSIGLYEYIDNNYEYFHFYLINAYGMFYGYHPYGTTTYGLDPSQIYNVLNNYVRDRFSSGVSVVNLTKSTKALTYEAIADSIDSGDPVLLAAYKEDGETGHAMVAYDYSVDSSGNVNEIYVHMGYLTDAPPTGKRTHVALSTTEYTSSLYAYALNVTIPHSCSNNYYNNDDENPTSFCSCCFSEHPEHAGHEHYNVYLPYTNTQHKITCAFCSMLTYSSHVVAAGSLNLTRCLDCGAMINLGLDNGVLQGVIGDPGDASSTMGTTIPNGAEIFTENGSYILSNGIIVLAEADVELYLKGELAIPE